MTRNYSNNQKPNNVHYHSEKDSEPTAHTLARTLSESKHLTSDEEILHVPLTVTWLLRSTHDLSTSKVAMCFSSGDRERDFSTASHGQTLIEPPSDPDHISPAQCNSWMMSKGGYTTCINKVKCMIKKKGLP